MDEEIIQTIILIIAAVLIYVLARRSKFKKDKSLKVNYKYEFSKILFMVYIIGLLGVLLLPVIRMGYSNNNGFYCYIVTYEWDYNLVPFKTISEQLGFLNSDMDKVRNGLLNLFVNSCIFIPFPVILNSLSKSLKLLTVFLSHLLQLYCANFYSISQAEDRMLTTLY